MRILILNNNYDEYAIGWSYKRAFASLGHQVQLIDPISRLKTSRLWNNRLSRRLFERPLIEAFNKRWLPELLEVEADLVWVGKGAWAVPWLWREFKEKRPQTKVICFNGDNPLVTFGRGGNRPWVTESIDCFDLFCTYNSHMLDALADAGARQVAWIPFAWDPEIHPMHPYGNFEYDVLFVGNGDEHRSKWLSEILSNPIAKNWNAAIYGRWPKGMCRAFDDVVHHKHVVGEEMAKLVACSRITLNILRVQNEGSHNMRTFETPGCGGVLASQFSDEQAEFLNAPEGAILFQDPDDAVLKIASALSKDGYLDRVAAKGRDLIHGHTYRDRAQQIVELSSGIN